jgi:hypothetical protein
MMAPPCILTAVAPCKLEPELKEGLGQVSVGSTVIVILSLIVAPEGVIVTPLI